MVSVRRIAIALGMVLAPFVAAAAFFWLRAAYTPWNLNRGLLVVIGVCAFCAAVPRLRRFSALPPTTASIGFVLFTLHLLSRYPGGARDLFRSTLDVFVLAALAFAVAGRSRLLRPVMAVVTATVLTILLIVVPLLVVLPFDDHWLPATWSDLRHLHPLAAGEVCRGVLLLDPRLHHYAYAHVLQATENFRGEHRPMVLLRGDFRQGDEWLPPPAIARMLVDDRDPSLQHCERAGRHPVWPLPQEKVGETLPY
jgi:hypothetical protein